MGITGLGFSVFMEVQGEMSKTNLGTRARTSSTKELGWAMQASIYLKHYHLSPITRFVPWAGVVLLLRLDIQYWGLPSVRHLCNEGGYRGCTFEATCVHVWNPEQHNISSSTRPAQEMRTLHTPYPESPRFFDHMLAHHLQRSCLNHNPTCPGLGHLSICHCQVYQRAIRSRHWHPFGRLVWSPIISSLTRNPCSEISWEILIVAHLEPFGQPLRKALLERFRNVAETGAGGLGLKDSCGVGALKGLCMLAKRQRGYGVQVGHVAFHEQTWIRRG